MFNVIHCLDELDAFSAGCVALSAGLPTHEYAWIRSAAETFATEDRLHFVVVGVPPSITALAPLVRSRNGSNRLELLGVAELYEPMDLLYATPSALATLTDALAGLGGCLALDRLPAHSATIAALRRSFRGRGIVICQEQRGAPWIPLDARWMQPEERLKVGRRSDLRRARRIAEAVGPVTFQISRPTPGELQPLLDEAMRVEALSWKRHAGTALVNDAGRTLFYRRYAAAACRKGALHVCFLRIGGQTAAMQIAVTSGGRFWLLKIGYDQAFARCSPGTLLMIESMRYAATQGLQSFEFLGIDEPWTRMWTELVHPCVALRAYPANWRGVSSFAADMGTIARHRLERTFRRAE